MDASSSEPSVGEMANSASEENLILETVDWETEAYEGICICSLPKTEQLIACSSETCPIGLYHAECVGLQLNCDPEERHNEPGLEDESATTGTPMARAGKAAGIGSRSGSTRGTLKRNLWSWYCEFCSNAKDTETDDPKRKPTAEQTTASDDGSHVGTSTTGKKRVKIPSQRSKVQMSKEDLLRDSTAIFQEALHAAEKEDHLKGSERGQSVLRICKQILLILTTTTLLASVKVIIEQIYDAASAGDNARIGSFASSKMCSTFHSMRIDSEVCRVWEDLISATTLVVPLDIIRLTQQYLMRKILYIITKRRIQQDSVQTGGEATLTDHDQNVIRYVAGYIPHALVKRYRKQTSEKAKKFLSILKSWKSGQEDIEADSFLEYTCTWTNLVNRGGLFTVNDKVFKLFRAMEIKTQKTLNMNIAKNQNLKDVLCKNVSSNENVIRCWQVLCESLCSDDSEILFSSVLNYWVKIRVKAYVRVYMNILRKEEILHKKQKKLSKKGEKSLRKGLEKDK